MPELEKVIEDKLIEQLVFGESQWTYREDLKTEEDLWQNFRYILEQNNKARLDGQPLSDAEFEQVKNQLQFSSFYKAGEWLVGENGKAMVHVQRDTEKLHLVVMNHEHIAGGSSVYEVINQYNALKDDDITTVARDRRFDVTLMINGLPMIHIELKNRQHSYMDAFYQIKKYISEGKFTGIFSAVQMFVISNGVDTKYFAAASDTELNPKFMSGWVDTENNPVADYIDFAKNVLRIPEAHEMIARYTVLDEDAKRLILLRPYQIHAIESIREASKTGKSGFVWHTTGSGKTLTSYKATRNLLMDIPAIDKAIFLIDRKDLDTQTTMAFQAYANNDLVDVDETDNVNDLKKKLKSDDRQVIVTTIQKMQILISKRLQEGTSEYNKIKNLKIAFVVDECHRAVTPKTKRELERFFGRSLWYGFTGTPRFAENPYPQMGDLPRTTEELYGKRLHKYTIQNAIHDNAVLGFQVEHNGPKNITDETDASAYDNETHMLRVLDIILNKSYHKLGFQNGKGQTYEGLLTTSSIQIAQKYYELLTKVKNGETSLEIDEKIKQDLPDFPKFAITYSVTENEEGSHVNQEKMQKSLDDYNQMFGTKYELSQIQGYNGNLNKRLARKDAKCKSRSEQLDLVIVVDRLLTGFDAPCMSTIFIDRQPMGPHDLIQAFSRTNRIFDKNKTYGQIVTFQAPKLFKESVDNAVKLYSAGSTGTAILAEWEEIEPAFRKSLAALRVSAETPEPAIPMSIKEKKVFVKIFQTFDRLFAQLKSFTKYDDSLLETYGITEEESWQQMTLMWTRMKESVDAYDPCERSRSGLVGKEGGLMDQYRLKENTLCGDFVSKVIANALKMGCNNACMKRIVAAPTAGACGVMPAVLVTYFREYGVEEDRMIEAMYVAAGIGQVIANRASLAGASGGCQAEIGSASGMAAAAICSVRDGSEAQMGYACAMALKNLMGLVCDPVAGLVEVPCVKRNVGGAVNALAAADMALAGIISQIPVDQVIDAMGEVGIKMDVSLRETSLGGVAVSPRGIEIAEKLGM